MRLNAVLHVEHHVDDVFVVGEHQRFLEALRGAAHADFGLAHARDVDNFNVLNGPRHAPVDAGSTVLRVLAEGCDNTDLTFGHDVDARRKPTDDGDAQQRGKAAPRERLRIKARVAA